MTIARLKAEFGPKDVITYGTMAIALLYGGFKLDTLVKTNAEGVVALNAIVENHDGRIQKIEERQLAEDNYEAGYEKALEEMGEE